MFKYIFPVLATGGVLFSVFVVMNGAKPVPASQPVAQPSTSPFDDFVAGAGIVEASTENINISTPVPGTITDVHVRVWDRVRRGDKLFQLDTRDLEAELRVREAALRLAESRVPEAEANAGDAKRLLELYQAVRDQRAITQEELTRRGFAVQAMQAQLVQARGSVDSAAAQVEQTKVEISRRLITAPVDGTILQVKIHPGEYAQVGPLETPLIVMGDVDRVNVRTDLDENDAWRFSFRARAVAHVRGNPKLETEVQFVRIEPFVVPKKSLTGDTTERVDTRVLQVLYAFDRKTLPVYVGQQMDVFIEAPGAAAPTTSASATEITR